MKFKNINHLKPLFDKKLGDALRDNHAYITASLNEPGGNHQNEGINCGLPVLYRNSGCMREYCEGFGIEFNQDNSIEYDEGYRSPGWDRYKKNKVIKWKK